MCAMIPLDAYGTGTSFHFVNHNLNECLLQVLDAANSCRCEQAKSHLMYGAGRRLRIIKRSFHVVANIVKPNRNKPLDDEEQVELNLHLNSLYLHLRGLMDNLAWAVVLEHGILGEFDEKQSKDRQRVGLFNKEFMEAVKGEFPGFYQALKEKADWNRELRDLRDPVAHRIPIYAVPSFLSQEEATEYRRKYAEAIRCINKLNFEESDRLLEEIGQIGTYVPVFHRTEDAEQKLYPVHDQVERDLDNTITVFFSGLRLFMHNPEA